MKFNIGSWAPFAYITIVSFLAADRSLEWKCSELAEPSIILSHVLANHFLKFCDRARLDRLDYGSAFLAGLPKQLMDRLQSVQNVAARLIFKACRQDHFQPLLRRLHWLRMPERTSFRLAVLVYRCLHGSAPGYLASDLQRVTPQRKSTTALFDYISAGRSTHCAFYHWRPHLSSDCCIGLEQFAEVSPVIAVVASFPQQTENWTFCPSYSYD